MRNLSRFNMNRIPHPITGEHGDNYHGAFRIGINGIMFTVIASASLGWDHVSVSHPRRTPTWDEMCKIKNMFFKPEETVVQYHPPKDRYINFHPYALHLWRWQEGNFPAPPLIMV